MSRARGFLWSCLSLGTLALPVTAMACSSKEDSAPPPGAVLDPEDFRSPPRACALECPSDVTVCEPNGYQCPAAAAWSTIPHAAECGNWDGKYPTPQAGKCKATLPTGEAAKKTGRDPDDAKTMILPTGYRARPAGTTHRFEDFKGQFTTNVVPVPGSDLVVVVDGGIREHSVRLVDTKLLETDQTLDPVIHREKYTGSASTNYGAAVVAAGPNKFKIWISGGAGSLLYVFDLDMTTRVVTKSADVKIERQTGWPAGGGTSGLYMLSGLAVTPDGKKLVVGTQYNRSRSSVFVVDIDETSATYKQITRVELAGATVEGRFAKELFTVAFHPSDTTGRYAWISVWDADRIDVLDLTTATVVKSIAVGQAPEAFAPIGPRHLAVVSSDADEIAIFDTLPEGGALVGKTKLAPVGAPYGLAPSGLAWDDAKKRLYVSLAGLNAVSAFEATIPADGSAPTLSPLGMIGTEWWPTAVTLRPDGALVVVNGKGSGSGANPIAFGPSEGNITEILRGSIQLVPSPDAAELTAGKTTNDAATDLGKLPGAPKVECSGAPYDFPVPATNTDGPSTRIEHVVFVVKENKTFDAVFGDMPGVDGDPKLVMAPGQMDVVFANQRKLAREFTNFDNYYTSAEQSIQGHVWTVFGRTTEFTERTWVVTWGRAQRLPSIGGSSGIPIEGGVFHWMRREKVPFDNMGELIGNIELDTKYPGLAIAQDLPDTEKACYIAARARVLCDLKKFTYALFPNDHTAGGSPGRPTVQTYIAVGDEGTGQLVEALSQSPYWKSTLVIVTEDDPQDGGDHVDAHRTPLYFAGPWVKRGYVSKGHYDMPSVHKLLAHIYGIPYLNEAVARAALPLDAFSSTPDYKPFAHAKRSQPLACNGMTGTAATEAMMSNWDFSEPDNQPGLSKQVWQMMHDGQAPPAGYGDDDDDDD